MGLFNRFRRYDEDEDEDEMMDTVTEEKASISLGGNNIELKVIRPSSFEQLLKAVDHLAGGKTILLNLEGTDPSLVRRMIDFISGAAYALHANIKQATKDSYFIAPGDVDVSGEIFKKSRDEDSFSI
jgi:cell division inhibitor SepF